MRGVELSVVSVLLSAVVRVHALQENVSSYQHQAWWTVVHGRSLLIIDAEISSSLGDQVHCQHWSAGRDDV